MKTKNSIIILAIALLSSCDVLDQKPTNNVSDSEVGSSASAAATLLNGAYHRLAANNYYGGGYFTTTVALASDNTEWVGSYQFLGNFDQHNYQADNSANLSAWYAIYSAINAANQTIKLTSDVSGISEAEKNRIIAEATIIRSLGLFDLARTWGNIPVIKEATTSPTQFNGVKQSDAKTVYQMVINDILSVRNNLALPKNRSNAYISQPVADAFLARVYLYLEDWANAEKYASQVISQTDFYELVPISDWLANKQTKESIFELAYSSSFSNEYYYYWQRAGGGRQEIGLSPELFDLITSPKTGGDRAILVSDDSTPTERLLTAKLYWRDANDDDPAYVFRLAEQYLIRSEARAKLGNVNGAIDDLNTIRQRSHVAEYDGSVAQTDVISAIDQERRIELAFEPHRWFDLVRTNRAVEVLGIDSHYTLFPIPNTDVLVDKDLEQNKGY